MRDVQGKNRGACTQPSCDCSEYMVAPTGNACDYCGCPPAKHANLDAPTSAPGTSPVVTFTRSPYFLPAEVQSAQGWISDGQCEQVQLPSSGPLSEAYQFVVKEFQRMMSGETKRRFYVNRVVAIRNNYSARLFLEHMSRLSAAPPASVSLTPAHSVLLPGIAQLPVAEENGVKLMYLWHAWRHDPMLQDTPLSMVGQMQGIAGNATYMSVQAEHACRARSSGILLLCCVAVRNVMPLLPTDALQFSFETCDAAYLPLTAGTPSSGERQFELCFPHQPSLFQEFAVASEHQVLPMYAVHVVDTAEFSSPAGHDTVNTSTVSVQEKTTDPIAPVLPAPHLGAATYAALSASPEVLAELEQMVGNVSDQQVTRLFILINSYLHDASFITKACNVMVDFLVKSRARDKAMIAGSNTGEILVQMLRQYQTDTAIVQAACLALRYVATDNARRNTLSEYGALEVVMHLIRTHTTEVVLERALDVLWNMGVGSKQKIALESLGAVPLIMSLWPQWGSKPYIAESICGILKVLSANDNNQVVIRKANGVSFLKQAINQHSNVASVVQQACTCLWYLSLKDDAKRSMFEDAVPALLMDMLKKHPQHSLVNEQACGALKSLAICDANQRPMMEAGLSAVLHEVIQHHMNTPSVLQQACGCIWYLSLNDDNKVDFGKDGTMQIVMGILRKHMKHAGTAAQASGALWNISVNADNKIAAMKEGALDLLLEALRTHPKDSAVAHPASGGVKVLASKDDHKIPVAQAGAIEVLLDVLRQHVTNPSVCQQAAIGVWNICTNVKNVPLAASAGAVDVYLSLWKEQPDSEQIGECVCGGLKSLAACDDLQLPIAAAGGVDAITSCMLRHCTYRPVVMQGCTALWYLALQKATKPKMIPHGVNALLSALRNFPKAAGVCEQACGALKAIASIDDNLEPMTKLGCPEAAVQVVVSHKDHPKVLVQAFSLIWYLALNDMNKGYFADHQTVALAMDALRKYGDSAAVCAQASGALWNICVNLKARTEAHENGAVDLMMTVLDRHIKESSVAHPGSGALKVLAAVEKNKRSMFEAGVNDMMLRILKQFPSNKNVCQQAAVCIWNLSVNYENQVSICQSPETVDTVLALWRQHGSDFMGECACGIFKNLAATAANRAFLVDKGCIDVALETLRSDHDGRAAFEAVSLLANLTLSDDIRDIIKKTDAVPLIVKASSADPSLTKSRWWKKFTARMDIK